MKTKNVVAGTGVVVLALAVTATTFMGVEIHDRYSDLNYQPAFELQEPTSVMAPVSAGEADMAALNAALTAAASNEALGTFHGRVTNATTGEVVWEQAPGQALTPASSTKILTAAAAILTLEPDATLTTDVVEGAHPGEVVIKAAGDVWLDDAALTNLADQLPDGITQVGIDTSVWQGDEILPGWNPTNIDAGYIAPLQPAMIHGGRIGETSGDVPRSHTPALDVAQALADRVGADTVAVGPAPADAETLASVDSPPLATRVEDMVKWSDNVMAEAIGREVAIDYGAEPTPAGATRATLEILSDAGFAVGGTELFDNSGLSTDNLIPPALLDDILLAAVTDEPLRELLRTLPVAHGDGTLIERYEDLPGRGWVRAKTGTLTAVNALAGTAVGESGTVYTFAVLSNGWDNTLETRRALDEFASHLRTA